MKSVVFLLALLAIPISARAAEIEPVELASLVKDTDCNIRISYGGMFVRLDPVAMQQMLVYLEVSPLIDRVRVFQAGREGEVVYCISTPNIDMRDRAFHDLSMMMTLEPAICPSADSPPLLPRVPLVSKK